MSRVSWILVIAVICAVAAYANATVRKNKRTGHKRTMLTTLKKEFPTSKTQEMIKKFIEIVQATFPATLSEDREFEDIDGEFMDVLGVASKTGGQDLFEQVEVEMGNKGSAKFADTTKEEKDFVNNLASGNDLLNKDAWIKLKDTKAKFLPQNQKDDAEYSKEYFADIATYAVTFIAATFDMILKGEVDQCQLSREMDSMKFDAETAVQSLIFRRLGMLKPESNSWSYVMGNDKINWDDEYADKKLCDDGGCILKDGDKNPVENSIKDVGTSVLIDAKIMFDVIDEILKNVAKGGVMCFQRCDCPEVEEAKIERVKYNIDFPWGCRGKLKRSRNSDDSRECLLPCGTYGESYDWCPVQLATKSSDWDYCKPSNLTCAVGWFKKK